MKIFILFFISASASLAADLNSEIYQKINHVRSTHGLSTLTLNAKLQVAAQSQSDWMAKIDRMEHLRERPSSFELFKECEHHPANRVIKAGYFDFDDLFSVEIRKNGAVVHPKLAANKNVNEIIAAGKAPGLQAYNTNIIVRGWMNSPGHKKVILTPWFEEFGIGISSLKHGEVYWCVVFANH
jgi:uncharacterized protein YkwD